MSQLLEEYLNQLEQTKERLELLRNVLVDVLVAGDTKKLDVINARFEEINTMIGEIKKENIFSILDDFQIILFLINFIIEHIKESYANTVDRRSN